MANQDDITLRKTMPSSNDAERSVLGSILINNALLSQAQELLLTTDFYSNGHRLIYLAMDHLSERGAALDIVTVKEELKGAGTLDEAGGPAYLASLSDGLPRASNIQHYCRIVKDRAIKRELVTVSNQVIERVFGGESTAQEDLAFAQRQIFGISDVAAAGFVPIAAMRTQMVEQLSKMNAGTSICAGIPTGFQKLDEMLSGLQAGELVVLGARPSAGKTALALNIADHVASREKKIVAVFSLEMSKEQLYMRMLCAKAHINTHRIRSGRLTQEEWDGLDRAFSALDASRIYIDDTPALGIFEMRAKARRLKGEIGADLVIVDYLQLMRGGGGRRENRVQEIGAITRALKALAKELALPVLAVSQLSRAPEQRGGDHKPQLSDLRESGDIEQDADVVMFIYRPEMYKPSQENKGQAYILVEKQRSGPTGSVELAFKKEFTRFDDLEWKAW